MTQVPVFKPLIEEEELNAAREALEMGWLGMGSYVQKFEEAVHRFIEAPDRHVAAVNTGHSALHLALEIAGVGPGDEVITPALNCISDFQAILTVGAECVFCEVEEDTMCIDVDSAASLVTPRTKAIVTMDYANGLCDYDRVRALADRHGLRVIHDAAHSFGSRYQGRRVGSYADISMFSFDPVKTVTCLDAGMLVVRSEKELKAIHELRLLGMGQPAAVMYQNKRAWTYHVERVGYRYHLLNLHGAMGLAQLAKIERIAETRRATCRVYDAAFKDIPGLWTPQIRDDAVPFIYVVRVPAGARADFITFLAAQGVDSGIHWQPGNSFALLAHCRGCDLSLTNRLASEIVTLPLHSAMQPEAQDRVVAAVQGYFGVGVRRSASIAAAE